jgi:hypothetical protein
MGARLEEELPQFNLKKWSQERWNNHSKIYIVKIIKNFNF